MASNDDPLTRDELGTVFDHHVWRWATELMSPAVGIPVAGFAARAAVGTVRPPLVIVGGPGTGKTRLAAAVMEMSHGWHRGPVVIDAAGTLTGILHALGSAKGAPVLIDDAVIGGGRPQTADRAAALARMHRDAARLFPSAGGTTPHQRSTAGALIMTAEAPIYRTADAAVESIEVALWDRLDVSAIAEGGQARARLMRQFNEWVDDNLAPNKTPSGGGPEWVSSAIGPIYLHPGLQPGQTAIRGGWEALLRFLVDSRAMSSNRAAELLVTVDEIVADTSRGSIAAKGPGRPSKVGGETILLRLSTELLAALDAHAERQGIARAEVIRTAITAHLDE